MKIKKLDQLTLGEALLLDEPVIEPRYVAVPRTSYGSALTSKEYEARRERVLNTPLP